MLVIFPCKRVILRRSQWNALFIIMALQYKDLVKPELLLQPVYQPGKPIEDVDVVASEPFTFTIAEDTFVDPDPGGVITLRGWLEDGARLPQWLTFNPSTRSFSGVPPAKLSTLKIKITARDYDGLEAKTLFSIRVTP